MVNELKRCKWTANITDPNYIEYHDTEWGTLVKDDRSLFELICLEGAMAGLSWNTILKKRDCYREDFRNFEIKKVVKLNDKDLAKILEKGGVVRHAGKIKVCPIHFPF
jgi:DNA-3-methyladenine glycosylase I